MKVLPIVLVSCGLYVLYTQYAYQRDMKRIQELHDQAYRWRYGK